ncbi:hypothetical protein H7F15_13770 [Pontibacter sp. Tf4]|uniref:hypothetical protein n=1 Tax=Pontibacter sp. Tf4 TaxID=2761620 RepID=UPI001628D185|nr:hypothetical protein [Pontibacter sp. Tf4]MBB6612113.1 hypothetical protein [Pontibacter sp. Tf4]
MKITSQIAVAALFFGLVSCSDSAKTENTTTTTAPAATAPATATPNQAATPATTVALNPPHGEPNHRCDIEVGAPLDSPPKPNLSAPVPAFTPSTSTVAPGTNPPHGQPGHDCGIPVGAPLTKK